MVSVKLIAEGGNMKPGPAIAQQLGPMGVNLGKVIEEVNKSTAGFNGMKVPVEITIDAKTKEFSITVSSPPVSELIKKELNLEKASGNPGQVKVGNLAIEQIISIAKTKLPDMLARDTKAAVKLVTGSCVSLGVLIEGKSAVGVTEEINSGIYDNEISQEKTEVSPEKKAKIVKEFTIIQAKQTEAAEAAKAEAAAEAAKVTEKKEATASEGEKPAEEKADGTEEAKDSAQEKKEEKK